MPHTFQQPLLLGLISNTLNGRTWTGQLKPMTLGAGGLNRGFGSEDKREDFKHQHFALLCPALNGRNF